MMSGDDDWPEGMLWVLPMPGIKNYLLQEAQKEIDRLRKEIERPRLEDEELQAGTSTGTKQPEAVGEREPAKRFLEGNVPKLEKGDYLYIAGVVKILDHSWFRGVRPNPSAPFPGFHQLQRRE